MIASFPGRALPGATPATVVQPVVRVFPPMHPLASHPLAAVDIARFSEAPIRPPVPPRRVVPPSVSKITLDGQHLRAAGQARYTPSGSRLISGWPHSQPWLPTDSDREAICHRDSIEYGSIQLSFTRVAARLDEAVGADLADLAPRADDDASPGTPVMNLSFVSPLPVFRGVTKHYE